MLTIQANPIASNLLYVQKSIVLEVLLNFLVIMYLCESSGELQLFLAGCGLNLTLYWT